MTASKRRPQTWVDEIERVLRQQGHELHVREIARLIGRRRASAKTPHQTISTECQRDHRFCRIERRSNTFDLSPLWKEPEATIKSMITVKSGSQATALLKEKALQRAGGKCQTPGCTRTKGLTLHHLTKGGKAEVLDRIAKRLGLVFGPDDPIRNILRAYTELRYHPEFRDLRYVEVLCKRHHDAKTRRQRQDRRGPTRSKSAGHRGARRT